jgi:hypothetical protein
MDDKAKLKVRRKAIRLLVLGKKPSEAVYFPTPLDEVAGSSDALDWTCRYLEGGPKVYAFQSSRTVVREFMEEFAETLADLQALMDE